MKKFFIFVFSIILTLSMAACGNGIVSQNEASPSPDTTTETVEDNTTENIEDSAQAENGSGEPEVENIETNPEAEGAEMDTTEWKQFLKDYEAWVEDYVKILKKYSENPTDMSIISDYTEMLKEVTEWEAKADEIEKELEEASPAEAIEYSAELLKITAKIAEAAY